MSTRSAGDTPPDVTVIIPTIPGRENLLREALDSVDSQTGGLDIEVVIERDSEGLGPSTPRNRGMHRASAEWLAFLDDDDILYPNHCAGLLRKAEETGADLVYPWFDFYQFGQKAHIPLALHGRDPFGQEFTESARDWVLNRGNFIPLTTLIRKSKLVEVGGFVERNSPEWPRPDLEDWGTWIRLLRAGAKFAHLPERTWAYWPSASRPSVRVG